MRVAEDPQRPEASSERDALRAFGEVLETVRDRVDAAVRDAAASVPVFAALLEQLDPVTAEAEAARSRELERRALIDGEWSAYLASLKTQGQTYALLRVELDDWWQLLGAYREVILDAAFELEDPARARLVIEGLTRFLDVAMSTLAASYLHTKEALLHAKEQELASHVRELERSNQELDDFAYVASHDLKAPLRDIQTLAQWIVEDSAGTLSEGSQRHLSTLEDRIHRMERLLADLLAYSRVGRVTGEAETVSLLAAIREAASVSLPSEGFDVVVEGDAVSLRTPRGPLETVLRNLMSNAAKHHDRDTGTILVRVRGRDGVAEVAVTDDGPGIPAELQGRVFRMFQTLRPRDEVEGSGMGLAIVKKIVEWRRGTVALESAPGEGTTVRFTWPGIVEGET